MITTGEQMPDKKVTKSPTRWRGAVGVVLLAAMVAAGCDSAEPLNKPTTPPTSSTASEPAFHSYNSIRQVVADNADDVPDDVPDALVTGFKELASQCDNGPIDSGTYLAICDTNGQPLLVGPIVVKGEEIESVEADTDQAGNPTVLITLTSAGAKAFADFTSENVTKRLAVLDDEELCMAPSIQDAILDGKIQISFGQDQDVDDVVECLRQ